MPHLAIKSSILTPQNSQNLYPEQSELLCTPPKQQHISLSPISRNPSSGEETNSEETVSERNPSNRSMSSIATSFESVGNRPVSKFYDDRSDNRLNAPPLKNLDDRHSPMSNIDSNDDPHKQNFPLPQLSNPTSKSIATDSSNNSITTAKLDHPLKYVHHSPKPTLSTSSSASSISSHRLVAKNSASSISRQRNFSTYRSPSPASSNTPAIVAPNAIADDPQFAGYGIAVDHPVVIENGVVTEAKTSLPDSIDPLQKHETDVNNVPPPASLPMPSSLNTERITQLPPPPSMRLVQRNSSSSQQSIASRGSFHVDDGKSSSSQHLKNPMTIVRRRSLPPQQLASSQNLPPDERTVLYRERVITMRELKRQKRREYEEDERVLVGNKVSEGHANYAAAYYMLTGIRVSVSRCNAKVNRDLTEDDFTARHKLAFDVRGNELIPSSRYDFKFKDYSPWVFRHLRDLFKLDPADYLMSLTSKYIVSELSSPGKSGSFFYFSRDYRFIIKTIHHSEHKQLRKILKEYYNHVKNNPNTLISQVYGLHRVKLPFGRKIHFIVMNNLFPPHHDLHRTYDLKGSSLGREYLSKNGAPVKSTAVLKDINWTKNKECLKLGPLKGSMFIAQLERDVALLKRLNIMDYSLLVGIHDKTKGDNIRHSVYVFDPAQPGNSNMNSADLRKAVNSTTPTAMDTLDIFAATFGQRDLAFYNDDGGFQATDANDQRLPEIYYLGIIDCLTPYTFVKRIETFWKGLSHSRNSISAIPAIEYGDRFFEFMKKAIQTQKRRGEVEVEVEVEAEVVLSATERQQLAVVEENASQEGSPKLSAPILNETRQ